MWVVDSHCHVGLNWYQPVESLLDEMARHDVAQAVLVQMLGQFHNEYLLDCAERFPGRFACVVGIDAAAEEACDELARLAGRGAAGVRLRPATRSPGDDPLAIWRAADRHGLVVSCVGNSESFATVEFRTLLATLPELTVVLEHLGGTSQPDDGDEAMSRAERVFELAELPNVFLKVPGLGELVPRLPVLPDSSMPFDARSAQLDLALERFGPERLMWGSDYPPVAAREGYGNALEWVRNDLVAQSAQAIELIFGATARWVFGLPDPV